MNNLISPDQISLYKLFGVEGAEETIFIRPEKIGVGQDPTKGVQGTVMEVKFLGVHYRLLIRTSEMDLIAYVEKAPSIHDQVFIFTKSL